MRFKCGFCRRRAEGRDLSLHRHRGRAKRTGQWRNRTGSAHTRIYESEWNGRRLNSHGFWIPDAAVQQDSSILACRKWRRTSKWKTKTPGPPMGTGTRFARWGVGAGSVGFLPPSWRQARDWYQKSLDIWTMWPGSAPAAKMDQSRRERAARSVARCSKT